MGSRNACLAVSRQSARHPHVSPGALCYFAEVGRLAVDEVFSLAAEAIEHVELFLAGARHGKLATKGTVDEGGEEVVKVLQYRMLSFTHG